MDVSCLHYITGFLDCALKVDGRSLEILHFHGQDFCARFSHEQRPGPRAEVVARAHGRQGKGDHVNIKMPNGQIITIPVSGDLKIGLLESAIRKAGLDDEDFQKLLKGD